MPFLPPNQQRQSTNAKYPQIITKSTQFFLKQKKLAQVWWLTINLHQWLLYTSLGKTKE